jgi:hypothetical protein
MAVRGSDSSGYITSDGRHWNDRYEAELYEQAEAANAKTGDKVNAIGFALFLKILKWFVIDLPRLLGKWFGNLSAILLAFGVGGKVILAPLVWLAGIIPVAFIVAPGLILTQHLAPSVHFESALWTVPLGTVLSHAITFDITWKWLIMGAFSLPLAVWVMKGIDYVENPSETFQTCSQSLYWGCWVVFLLMAGLTKLFGWAQSAPDYSVGQIIVMWILFLALGVLIIVLWMADTQEIKDKWTAMTPEEKAQWRQELMAKRQAQRAALFSNIGQLIKSIFWRIAGLIIISAIGLASLPFIWAYFEHSADKEAEIASSYYDLTKSHFSGMFTTINKIKNDMVDGTGAAKPTPVRKAAVVLGKMVHAYETPVFGAGTEHRFNKGEQVAIVEETEGTPWVKVEIPGNRTGYVNRKYLDIPGEK